MARPHFVFAGGGTGGHLFPGIAVADALIALDSSVRVTFFTTDRELDADLLKKVGYPQRVQSVRPFSTRPWHWPAFYRHWRTSVSQASRSFAAERPEVVLGLGGYAAGPPVVAAHRMGIRSAILNPDRVPGRANRYLARRADLIIAQWEASRASFSEVSVVRALGCPIRAAFSDASAARGRELFGLASERPVLLVTGASQGARTINEALARVWPRFHVEHPEWQLLHLTGSRDESVVSSAYTEAGTQARVCAFTHDMQHALAAADVVISRAGASTLAEITALGKSSILLPYPYHRDRHQHANAQVLVDDGAAILIDDARAVEPNSIAIRAALEELSDFQVRERMSTAAAALGRRDAAQRVAEWMLDGSEG